MRTKTFHGGRSISLLGTAGQNKQAYFFPGADKTGGVAHPCFPLVPWIVTTEAAPPVAVFDGWAPRSSSPCSLVRAKQRT